ncbi:hypothetical protein, partial [Paremcibacter congregatus]|uniref:hypothetical protein n=1 Tax=Paremcibacter congregatus TaxID=2043170 RepID=UPI003A8CEDFC
VQHIPESNQKPDHMLKKAVPEFRPRCNQSDQHSQFQVPHSAKNTDILSLITPNYDNSGGNESLKSMGNLRAMQK